MKIEPCAICGSAPIITSQSLDYGHGHGYPGRSEYEIRCWYKECPLSKYPVSKGTDIYDSKEQVYDNLFEAWNQEARKIKALIEDKQ